MPKVEEKVELSQEKLQEAHDKKVKAEVDALKDEAKKKKIEVSDGYNNPESIRALIDKVEASRKKTE